MSGSVLHAVGLWLFIPSAIVLVFILFTRERRKSAIYQNYLTRYGSKLFFSVHPELKDSAQRAPEEESAAPDAERLNQLRERLEQLVDAPLDVRSFEKLFEETEQELDELEHLSQLNQLRERLEQLIDATFSAQFEQRWNELTADAEREDNEQRQEMLSQLNQLKERLTQMTADGGKYSLSREQWDSLMSKRTAEEQDEIWNFLEQQLKDTEALDAFCKSVGVDPEKFLQLLNWMAQMIEAKKRGDKEKFPDISGAFSPEQLAQWADTLKWVQEEIKKRDRTLGVFYANEFPYLLPDEQNALIHHSERSDIYLAAHKRTGKHVVIKVGKSLKTNREQLQNIVFSLRDLRHPMIPTLYDFYSNDKLDVSYTIMEFVDGETLQQLLEKNALAPQTQCLNWTYDLLDALGYLHKKGISHGDIQPSNVILSPDGSLRLIDFSKAISNLNGEANPRQDLYQLGAMMFRLLTGMDFRESDAPEKRETILRERGVSASVAGVILKATAEKEETRYRSVEEMLSDLRDMILNGEEIRRHHLLMRGLAPAALVILTITGAVCAYSGRGILIDEANILQETRQASDAFDKGDYSQALERALDAANMVDANVTVSGKVKAEAERVLAKVLGVYDLSPGYKPDYSIGSEILLGRPIKAAVSPDGKRLVALVPEKADADGVPAALYLQFFDAQSGRELAKPVEAYPSALSEFEFLDERILLYAGERDMTVCALPETPPDDGELSAVKPLKVGRPATGIAVSADGKVAASIRLNDNEATLYHIVRDGDSVRLENATHLPFPDGKAQSARENNSFTDPMDNLFALNGTGEQLALSFADGSLYIVDVSDFSRLNDPEIYTEISLPSNRFRHFEGGFCGDFFLYSASTKSLSGAAFSYYQTLRTDTMEALAGLSAPGEIRSRCHALTDSGAAYLSVDNELRRADFSSGTWETIDAADAAITLLRYDAGRVLVVTANDAVTVYDDAEGRLDVSTGTPYNIAAFAGDTLLLAHQDRPTLSVLRRTEREPMLRYYPAFEHMYACVHSDLTSSLLFRAHDCQPFDADGYSIGYHAFDDYADVLKQYYLRASETAGPLDMLATVYADRIDYYDAKTANFLYSEAVETNPDASDKFFTEDYFIETRVNEFIRVRSLATDKIIWEVNKENLKDAVQQGTQLILSMLTMDGTQYSLLLSENGDILADLPNLCDVLPDGTLAFDYRRGELYAGRLYSIKDLIALASDRRSQRT